MSRKARTVLVLVPLLVLLSLFLLCAVMAVLLERGEESWFYRAADGLGVLGDALADWAYGGEPT